MQFQGQILKMTSFHDEPIQYYLNLSGDLIHMNELFGKELTIKHTGYQCVNCGENKPIYRMGFCKNCFFESPYASDTIIRPELSTAHLGIAERDLDIEKEIQLQPHTVYLAYTGEVKVGVTRNTQIPTRWIDQGATFALPIARTENRYEAGMIEVALKQHVADKTSWKKMLQDDFEDDIDLADFQQKIKEYFPEDFQKFYSEGENLWRFDYPFEKPEKVTSFTLDKRPEYTGKLTGIKGQYLGFDGGEFINVRGHEGYVIELTVKN
ncbi:MULTISPECIES: DUF2797 domain-containing protein [Chryseobacterium]|jgi:hypothetical protein|uniref:DUF2797 domain-containing protein n=1 Tax=Chryseobacterium gambrini TaxID=373672 RepID=A0A1N7MEK9_9FLAO|nr:MULTISPECIES: DUF2797 domain-containing protein [Chryseobacterium]MCQ4139941.1 DUF2797 domain-containing protein [Chryseobacterium sp. EO14]MCY1659607.1 DUF2797 domain-containing protein [Chryseobacterium sp. SL1]BEV05283.1 DUF2797 domain-containing protein [Chryseobacterium gambrini]SIS84470.1 Protein of unknown function [Chryseobacterium gambrini]